MYVKISSLFNIVNLLANFLTQLEHALGQKNDESTRALRYVGELVDRQVCHSEKRQFSLMKNSFHHIQHTKITHLVKTAFLKLKVLFNARASMFNDVVLL